jgi:predicted transcriptional regulator
MRRIDNKLSALLASDDQLRRRVISGLRQMRRALGLNQWDVAARANCSQASISLAERGIRLREPLLRKIIKALLELDAEASSPK